jgi:acetylglutamate kinase
MSDILVVKIGGSTLGSGDTTIADIAELHRRGYWPVVVHGGGAVINDWLKRLDVPTRFEDGLRVTDEASLDVVIAVLAGLVNKQLVAQLQAAGVPAVGLSGADGGMLHCRIADEKLGFVGEIDSVDPGPLVRVLLAGAVPVIAPIGLLSTDDAPAAQLLNTNADIAAGAIAFALRPGWMALLTDVPGVMGADGKVQKHLTRDMAAKLRESGVIQGGMIPKVDACLHATEAGCRAVILDGRAQHALLSILDSEPAGTIVGQAGAS